MRVEDQKQEYQLEGPQLQEGLRYDLMKPPAVSGALNYQALCVAVFKGATAFGS